MVVFTIIKSLINYTGIKLPDSLPNKITFMIENHLKSIFFYHSILK